MTPELLTPVLQYGALGFCVIALVFYRLMRKFKKERPKNKREFLDHNIVELAIVGMYFALVSPKWITFWLDLF